jgi:hypothetical protein
MARVKQYLRVTTRVPPLRCVPAGASRDDVGASLAQHRAQARRAAAAAAAAAAAPAAPVVAGLGVLPHAVLLRIFALLPVRERLHTLPCVARSWCRFVAVEAALLWADVDLSAPADGGDTWVDDALLRAATAASGGALRCLDVSGCFDVQQRTHANYESESESDSDAEEEDEGAAEAAGAAAGTPSPRRRRLTPRVTRAALHAALGANAGTLRQLRALSPRALHGGRGGGWPCCALPPTHVFALLRAAPVLRTLRADVVCTPQQAPALLARQGPFRALAVRRLTLRPTLAEDPRSGGEDHYDDFSGSYMLSREHQHQDDDHADVATLLRAAAAALLLRDAAAASEAEDGGDVRLEELVVDFGGDDDEAPMGGSAAGAADAEAAAAVELAAAAGVRALSVRGVGAGAAAAAALRAVPSLVELHVTPALRNSTRARARLLGGADGARAFGAALHDAPALRTLSLRFAETDGDDDNGSAAELSALLPALAGHATLRRVELRGVRRGAVRAAAGGGGVAAALVVADAPALRELRLRGEGLLLHEQLPALFEALARNGHLRALHVDVSAGEQRSGGVTAALVRQRLLPALRRNAALRRLRVRAVRVDERGECVALRDGGFGGAWREAEELLAARGPAHD